ncbi:MAG: serine/threonine protein kinase [Pirellulales bacterium]|nr:serine/threonine protein kinase [Pirellulales bacterium]
MSTTLWPETRTITFDGAVSSPCPNELLNQYHELLSQQRLAWTEHLHLKQLLGTGGQGVVYLSERRGTDEFTLPVAMKVFSPEHFESERSYLETMVRVGRVACQVARIAHDNLLDVQNFIERYRIRIMEMEWIDGYDLARLLTQSMLDRVERKVSKKRWMEINDVIVTTGPVRPRLKPGIAVAIIRECLGGLAALHREEIVHGDVKPSNIMIKRTGNAKIIDIGSAIELNNRPKRLTCTPAYAAPETIDRDELTPQSDLASLGYVLIEMLSGRPLFAGIHDYHKLVEAKRVLSHRLGAILPKEVADSQLLLTICRRLTAADPTLRYASAEDADTGEEGLAEFQRTLVRGDLATEAEHDIRFWLEELD